jgi:sigma-54 dependent transcriptional regulator, acetoin dehydrogenase operon transcriptional activator AcoR
MINNVEVKVGMKNSVDVLDVLNSEYYDFAQSVAEAVEAAMGIDVTIIDNTRNRIAGTGYYKAVINQPIEDNTAFAHCLEACEPIELLEVGDESCFCRFCSRREDCVEKAAICVPIKVDQKAIGVIGVIAFNEEQKNKIICSKSSFLNFLHKMASLLEAKYSKSIIESENKKLIERISLFLNIMTVGVVVYKGKGEIIYQNNGVHRLLLDLGIKDRNRFLNKIWQDVNSNMMAGECANEPVEVVIEYNEEKYYLLAYINTAVDYSKSGEVVVSLHDYRKITKKIIQSEESKQIRIVFDDILGFSPMFRELKKDALKAALTETNILIYGESGTGKEMFARAIHNSSNRKDHPFIPINCGAIPENLLESEMFGYEKGAFTGAGTAKMGKFELADNGTLFLDEIGELPYRSQVKLLRAIQEGEVCRIGDNKIRIVNVRIIAATNADLEKQIKSGTFRSDLFYRLNIIPINLPPLRERRDEIIEIASFFVTKSSRACGKDINKISAGAGKILLEYNWPGNIRELQNVIEYAVNYETGLELSKEVIARRIGMDSESGHKPAVGSNKSFAALIKDYEKVILLNKIDSIRKSKVKSTKAISQLCWDLEISRATLYRKLKEFNICLNDEIVS